MTVRVALAKTGLAAGWNGPSLTEPHDNVSKHGSSIASAGVAHAKRVGGFKNGGALVILAQGYACPLATRRCLPLLACFAARPWFPSHV